MGNTITTMDTTITTTGEAGLYRLMAWLSPSYPVGAFSYSHGIEWAVECGDVTDAPGLHRWIGGLLRQGGGWTDAVLFGHAWAAAHDGDEARLAEVCELAAALAPSRERRLETCAQGDAFVTVTERAWPCGAVERLRAAWSGPVAYPVAVGVAAAGHGIALGPALSATLHAWASNLVSAGVRLIPLGQTDAQRVIAALEGAVADVAARAPEVALDDIGGMAILGDIASMRHETQYTRLFRT